VVVAVVGCAWLQPANPSHRASEVAIAAGSTSSSPPFGPSDSLSTETPDPDGVDADGTPPASFSEPPITTNGLPIDCSSAMPGVSPAPSVSPVNNAHLSLKVPVLEYHRIVPFAQAGTSLRGLIVPPNTFDDQMKALAGAGWHTITAAELATDLAHGVKPARKTVILTFDDGWWDGYTYVLPILQKYGFVGTFYVITGRIGDGNEMSADQIRALFAAGMEIGDHTVWHTPLARLPVTQARSEIIRAAQDIALITGQWPRTIAYPYGSFDTNVVDILASCHPFLMAMTIQQSTAETWATRFATPRIKITSGVNAARLLARIDPFA
jgi:peptidoglycan/xylan/chitin deacetylase (PgdA/CDA1 family)